MRTFCGPLPVNGEDEDELGGQVRKVGAEAKNIEAGGYHDGAGNKLWRHGGP